MLKEKKGKQRPFYSLEPLLLGIYPTTGVWTGLCPTSGQGGVETPGRVPFTETLSKPLVSVWLRLGPESGVGSRPEGSWRQYSTNLHLSWCQVSQPPSQRAAC